MPGGVSGRLCTSKAGDPNHPNPRWPFDNPSPSWCLRLALAQGLPGIVGSQLFVSPCSGVREIEKKATAFSWNKLRRKQPQLLLKNNCFLLRAESNWEESNYPWSGLKALEKQAVTVPLLKAQSNEMGSNCPCPGLKAGAGESSCLCSGLKAIEKIAIALAQGQKAVE